MKPRLSLATQYATKAQNVPTRRQFRRWVAAALTRDAEIALRIVDAEEGRALNAAYRGRDYPTNVLAFPLSEAPLMGDIVLCAPVVGQEAAAQGKALEAHYAHLTVHGVLHLLGHDHENDDAAAGMEALETQIVTKLGYADPYATEQGPLPHGG